MHGAAQTANAPPSRAPEPPRRARCSRPGATARSGHGSSADEREPDHDEHEAGDLGLGRLRDDARDRRRPGAEHDEHDREAGDERHARRARFAVPSPRSPSAVDLERRDRREVAGDERQHARRDHRDQARRGTRSAASQPSKPRELLVDAALELRVERAGRLPASAPAGAGRALRDHYQAPPAIATAPTAMPPNGQHPREQVEAVRARERRALPSPSCATSAFSIRLFVQPSGDVRAG